MYVTIHQPYFIPWLGYFSKLAYSSHFIVLDDVLFRKRHYLDRTRVVNMHSEIQWINVPVGQNYKKPLNEVYVNDSSRSYMSKIIRTIESSYSKAKCFEQEWGDIRALLESEASRTDKLVDINVGLFTGLLNILNVRVPEIIMSSNLDKGDFKGPTGRLEAIFDNVPHRRLLIGDGKSGDVHDFNILTENNIEIYKQDFLGNHPKYVQSRRKVAGFKSGLSILDCLLNVGKKKTLELIHDKDCEPYKQFSQTHQNLVKEIV